ncbi:ABC transporter ATP-binding protein [Paenibacillus thermotolerans]|uniref:ABC transporter ATP-binding protein n=1 Tax=Paenibacillus thermotolerans TaxID=3027807 RepID=UPI00236833A1|nr:MULTISPECIES: ABC transporter ATP-binding protein [unclassified Paenibacillus]
MAIELHKVSKRFRGFTLEPLSLRINQGYITGLIGQNGAGKSTTLRILLQLLRPDTGNIRIFGLDPATHGVEIKERIGFVLDENHFYEHLSAEEMKRIIAPFYSSWNEKSFRQYADRFELPLRRKIKQYSKGMKMKLSLAIALSHETELLIMDEPTSGLDPVVRREVIDLLQEYIQNERRTVIFSTHITTDLESVADYIAFLHKGRLVFHETVEDINDRYALVKGKGRVDDGSRSLLVGCRQTSSGFEGLTADRQTALAAFPGAELYEASLEEIMYFTAQGGARNAQAAY